MLISISAQFPLTSFIMIITVAYPAQQHWYVSIPGHKQIFWSYWQTDQLTWHRGDKQNKYIRPSKQSLARQTCWEIIPTFSNDKWTVFLKWPISYRTTNRQTIRRTGRCTQTYSSQNPTTTAYPRKVFLFVSARAASNHSTHCRGPPKLSNQNKWNKIQL